VNTPTIQSRRGSAEVLLVLAAAVLVVALVTTHLLLTGTSRQTAHLANRLEMEYASRGILEQAIVGIRQESWFTVDHRGPNPPTEIISGRFDSFPYALIRESTGEGPGSKIDLFLRVLGTEQAYNVAIRLIRQLPTVHDPDPVVIRARFEMSGNPLDPEVRKEARVGLGAVIGERSTHRVRTRLIRRDLEAMHQAGRGTTSEGIIKELNEAGIEARLDAQAHFDEAFEGGLTAARGLNGEGVDHARAEQSFGEAQDIAELNTHPLDHRENLRLALLGRATATLGLAEAPVPANQPQAVTEKLNRLKLAQSYLNQSLEVFSQDILGCRTLYALAKVTWLMIDSKVDHADVPSSERLAALLSRLVREHPGRHPLGPAYHIAADSDLDGLLALFDTARRATNLQSGVDWPLDLWAVAGNVMAPLFHGPGTPSGEWSINQITRNGDGSKVGFSLGFPGDEGQERRTGDFLTITMDFDGSNVRLVSRPGVEPPRQTNRTGWIPGGPGDQPSASPGGPGKIPR